MDSPITVILPMLLVSGALASLTILVGNSTSAPSSLTSYDNFNFSPPSSSSSSTSSFYPPPSAAAKAADVSRSGDDTTVATKDDSKEKQTATAPAPASESTTTSPPQQQPPSTEPSKPQDNNPQPKPQNELELQKHQKHQQPPPAPQPSDQEAKMKAAHQKLGEAMAKLMGVYGSNNTTRNPLMDAVNQLNSYISSAGQHASIPDLTNMVDQVVEAVKITMQHISQAHMRQSEKDAKMQEFKSVLYSLNDIVNWLNTHHPQQGTVYFPDMEKLVIDGKDNNGQQRKRCMAELNLGDDATVYVVGDLDGQLSMLYNFLLGKNIIKEVVAQDGKVHLEWINPNAYVVQCGDQIDSSRVVKIDDSSGEPKEFDLSVLLFTDYLAAISGGKFISIIGNHEWLNVFRESQPGPGYYVHEANAMITNGASDIYSKRRELFKSRNVIGRILRRRHVLFRINNVLFSHAGVGSREIKQHVQITNMKGEDHKNHKTLVNDLINRANQITEEDQNYDETKMTEYMKKVVWASDDHGVERGIMWNRVFHKDDGYRRLAEKPVPSEIEQAIQIQVIGHNGSGQKVMYKYGPNKSSDTHVYEILNFDDKHFDASGGKPVVFMDSTSYKSAKFVLMTDAVNCNTTKDPACTNSMTYALLLFSKDGFCNKVKVERFVCGVRGNVACRMFNYNSIKLIQKQIAEADQNKQHKNPVKSDNVIKKDQLKISKDSAYDASKDGEFFVASVDQEDPAKWGTSVGTFYKMFPDKTNVDNCLDTMSESKVGKIQERYKTEKDLYCPMFSVCTDIPLNGVRKVTAFMVNAPDFNSIGDIDRGLSMLTTTYRIIASIVHLTGWKTKLVCMCAGKYAKDDANRLLVRTVCLKEMWYVPNTSLHVYAGAKEDEAFKTIISSREFQESNNKMRGPLYDGTLKLVANNVPEKPFQLVHGGIFDGKPEPVASGTLYVVSVGTMEPENWGGSAQTFYNAIDDASKTKVEKVWKSMIDQDHVIDEGKFKKGDKGRIQAFYREAPVITPIFRICDVKVKNTDAFIHVLMIIAPDFRPTASDKDDRLYGLLRSMYRLIVAIAQATKCRVEMSPLSANKFARNDNRDKILDIAYSELYRINNVTLKCFEQSEFEKVHAISVRTPR
jgi:hypothetical protein